MDNKEIGGYFELEHFDGTEYHVDAIALNSARGCAEYLIEARGIKTLWTPWYLCSSVDNLCSKLGVAVKHFQINPDFTPDYDGMALGENEYLYLVDYYGQLSDDDIREAERFANGRLIVDEVMAFFRKPLDGIDTLYSCRKFFGVADGGYLYTDARLKRKIPVDESRDRMDFVLGRCERPANDFYSRAAQNNHVFADEGIKYMSPITRNILRAVNYKEIAKKRRTNFERLASRLDDLNELSPKASDGAFMYPLLIDNGRVIRKELQARKIYISMLWGRDPEPAGISGRYALDILPMVCDQRYGLDDMDYESRVLKSILSDQ